uniref:LAGLIDADG homing endonuclease n=1 Tax=Endoconidiophora resinifera TaxID=1580851 RepID=A0A3Q8UAT4_9PEZI|nr:LAGLIDADG homing endonuclease [Endoconidiophora resinifera]
MRKNLIQYNINNLNNNSFKFLSRTYASLHNVDKLEVQFLEWFVGFSDAESSFILHKVLDKKGDISKFSFMFTIELHIDDLSVLEFIKNKLKIGNLRTYKDKCIFTVSDKQGVYQLISIFDKFNLNTTKYLDYKNFKEAFLLYHERSSNVKIAESKELINKILGYKSNMNTKRSVIISPRSKELEYLSKINITKDWLLGFIEGDGSFFVSRTDIEPVFSIELSEEQYPMLVKIKEFLEDNLGFDKYSLFKLKSSSIISINKQKARLGKPTVILSIKNIFVLNNYLIPLLDSMEFISKKGCDFKDFKVICGAVYRGTHKLDEIRSLILKLSYNMNNYRLSTNKKSVEILSEQERNLIINAESVYEYLEDGRIMDKKTNKPLIHRNCIYEIRLSDEEILLVDTMKEALSKINVSFRTLKKLLDEEESVKLPNYEVKRIPIFTIKKI